MNEEIKYILNILKESNDRLSSKFDEFFEKQDKVNDEVRDHGRRLSELEESKEEKWATSNPIKMEVVRYIVMVVGFLAVAHLFPSVAKLIGSI